jgi:hypothetical protein
MGRRRTKYEPGKIIRTRPALLKAVDYYLSEEGPQRTRELYKKVEGDIQIKGMNIKSFANIIGKSGLFPILDKNHFEGYLWSVP